MRFGDLPGLQAVWAALPSEGKYAQEELMSFLLRDDGALLARNLLCTLTALNNPPGARA